MTMKRILLGAFAGVLSAGGAAAGEKSPPAKAIQVYSHRGGRAYAPENTMPAYRAALKVGADWVDMDVVLTKDGEVVIGHDLVLSPAIARDAQGRYLTPDQQYAVKNLSFTELETFDVGRLNPESAYAKFFPDQFPVDGTHMPALREAVRYVNGASGGKVGFQIEMKTDPTRPEVSPDPAVFASALYKILREEGILGRAEIQAFDWRCLYELRRLDSRVKTAYLTSRESEKGGSESFFAEDAKAAGLWTGGKLVKDYGGSIPAMVKALGGFAWEPEDAELTRESLEEAKRLGLKVVVWSWPEKLGTAFDAGLAAKMIDWGVDGIITDDPGRLSSMLAARGLRLPRRYP